MRALRLFLIVAFVLALGEPAHAKTPVCNDVEDNDKLYPGGWKGEAIAMYLMGLQEGHATWADMAQTMSKANGDIVGALYHSQVYALLRSQEDDVPRLVDLVHAECLKNRSLSVRDAYLKFFVASLNAIAERAKSAEQ